MAHSRGEILDAGTLTAPRADLPRLLFVINSPIIGGAERHTFDLAGSFAARGCAATIFCMKAGSLAPPAGVELLMPDRPRSLPSRIGDLARLLRASPPGLIISVNERPVFATFVARLAARRRMPIVAITHSTVLRNRREELMQLVYTPVFNRVESVVFISHNQRDFWKQRGLVPRNEVTILNGIDLNHYSPAIRAECRAAMRERLGIGPDDFVIGLCAVMRPEKNHLQIVSAVSWLRQKGIPAKALLVGDGPMRPAIEERARSLGVSGEIIMAGMHKDVRPFLAAFDVGCLCSVSIETLSLAALEAMAMGIPMVMSDLGGASEIIDGSNGRLFPVGSDADLRSALLSLTDPDIRSQAGRSARLTTEHLFDRETMISHYVNHLLGFSLRR